MLKHLPFFSLLLFIAWAAMAAPKEGQIESPLLTPEKVERPSSIAQELKIAFGLSRYKQSFNIPEKTEDGHYPALDKNFSSPTRGFTIGYGIEFFKNNLFSTTSSLNISHYRNDFDKSSREPHYRINSTPLFFEQQLNLNIELQATILRPFLTYGIGSSYTRSSYRSIIDNKSNYYLKSTQFNNFTKAGLGLMFIDKKKDLFSFIRGDIYFPHSSQQKIKMDEQSQVKTNSGRYEIKRKGLREGATQSIMLGAGGRF